MTGIGMRAALIGAAALTLAACAASPDGPAPAGNSSVKLSDVFATPDWAKFTGAGSKPLVDRAITPDDLMTAEGHCAGAPAQASAMAPGEGGGDVPPEPQGAPLVGGGIALAMSECEVVQRAGMPTQFDIGSDGGERIATLTYLQGQWPGVYRFRGGRLVSVERVQVPEPAKPKRPPARTAKPSGTPR